MKQLTQYRHLSTKDKLAFLSLFQAEAQYGPPTAAQCLGILDVVVSESDLHLVFRALQWPEESIAWLRKLAPDHLTL